MSDIVIDRADVIEIVTAPTSITEVVGLDSAGLVMVTDVAATFIEIPENPTAIVDLITAGPIGPRGPIGPAGSDGPQGPYAPIFEQHFAEPLMMWVIHHDLGVYPVVTLYDEDFNEISGDVLTPDKYTVIVDFDVPFAGTARLKG